MHRDISELRPAPAEASEPEARPPQRRRSRRRPIYPWIALTMAVVLASAGVTWWLLATTVPMAEYNEIMAALSDTEDELATRSSELATISAEKVGLTEEVESLGAASTDLERQLDQVRERGRQVEDGLAEMTEAAIALTTGSLWNDPAWIAELRDAGLDESLAEQLMADLGIEEPYSEWLGEESWLDISRLISRVDDPQVQASWDAYLTAEFGSLDEQVAIVELFWRLNQILIQPLLELGDPSTRA